MRGSPCYTFSMRNRLFWASWAGICAFIAFTCAFTVVALQHRFGGYDLSPLIDAGWRVLLGQVPNRDFICTFPPILYLAAAAAFRIFGVRWIALSLTSVIFSSGLTLLGMRILLLMRPRFSDRIILRLSLALAILEMIPLLVVGHPWHSSWTQAAALYALVATFALAELPTASSPVQYELVAHLALAECLLVLAKPNTAVPALAFCTFALLLSRQPWWKAFLPLAIALLAASLLLSTVHTSIAATWHVYLQLRTRMLPSNYFEGIIANRTVDYGLQVLIVYLALLPMLLWMIGVAFLDLFRHRLTGVSVLAVGACLVTIAGFGTNAEFKIVDAPCLLFGAALLGASRWVKVERLASGYFFVLYALFGISLFYCLARARMQAVGEWGNDSCGLWQEKRTDPFFGTFKNCAPLFYVLAESDAALAAHPGARVFFGPRMEFLYARDRVTPPEHLPLWWHPGTSYPLPDASAITTAWKDDHFDLLIFLHNDFTRIPAPITDLLNREYTRKVVMAATTAPRDSMIDVYVPKSTALAR